MTICTNSSIIWGWRLIFLFLACSLTLMPQSLQWSQQHIMRRQLLRHQKWKHQEYQYILNLLSNPIVTGIHRWQLGPSSTKLRCRAQRSFAFLRGMCIGPPDVRNGFITNGDQCYIHQFHTGPVTQQATRDTYSDLEAGNQQKVI